MNSKKFFIPKSNRYRLYFFIFIYQLSCSVNEKTARNVIFKVLTQSKVLNRLDLSDNIWEQFNVQNKKLKKQGGLMK